MMFTTEQQYAFAFRTAIIAGLFSAIVCALLLNDFRGRVEKDPLNSPEYITLKTQLLKDRQNAELKEQVRAEDLQLREKYFHQRRFAGWGTWLLLAGVAISLSCAKWATKLHQRLPKPVPNTTHVDPEIVSLHWARWAVGALLLLGAATISLLALTAPRVLPQDADQLAELQKAESAVALVPPDGGQTKKVEPIKPDVKKPIQPDDDQPGANPTTDPNGQPDTKKPPSEQPKTKEPPHPTPDVKKPDVKPQPSDLSPLPAGFPTAEEMRKNWPRFRGADGMGVSPYTNIPTQWDGESGEGIIWKTEVPLPGNSSAIVWEKRVFLTGATKDQRQVLCFDAENGKLLWRQDVPGTPESTAKPVKVNEQTGFAASTPATDGRRVYAIFANGDLAAFDFDGRLRWSRSFGIPKNSYGHASSLAVEQGLVLVQLDQGAKGENLSRLIAVRAETGETAWETQRDMPSSWPTPIVIQHEGQALVISGGSPFVIANALKDGKEIWRAKVLSGDVGPSPVFANGMIYVANEFPAGSAIKLGGSGDVTKSHVAWQVESGLPDCVTPLLTEKHLFLVASYGMFTCYDAQEGGDPLWEKEFEDSLFSSSPGMVGNRIYLFEDKGKVFIVEPTEKECKVVSEPKLGENCVTCPAFQDGRLFIRGKTNLFCIGKK